MRCYLEFLDDIRRQRLSVESGYTSEALEGLLYASLAKEPAGTFRDAEVEPRDHYVRQCDHQQK
jgi:hypothetical protein